MRFLHENIERPLHEICLFSLQHVGLPGITDAPDYIDRTFRSCCYSAGNVPK